MNKIIEVTHTMKQTFKKTAAVLSLFALIVSANPVLAIEVKTTEVQTLSVETVEVETVETTTVETQQVETQEVQTTDTTVYSCDLKANTTKIATGGSVTLTWETQGFTKFTLNGQTINGANDSVTIDNVMENTTYTFVATNDDGSQECTATVAVECVPETTEPARCDNQYLSAQLVSKTDDQFTVKFTNDNDCEIEVGASSYKVPVNDQGYLCNGSNLGCQIRHDFEDIVLGARSMQEVTVAKPTVCYQIDWYRGTSIEKFDPQNGVTYSQQSRLLGAKFNATIEDCGEVEEKKATVVAHKIVCTEEADLPNWGTGGPDITANTAKNWVESHDSCTFASGWEFEWTDDQSTDPGDTLVGVAGAPWNTFGPTDTNGRTSVEIDLDVYQGNLFWFREVLKSNYIPFTHGLNSMTNVDDVSAEFYCHNDVINYDNRDFVSNLKNGETYYCVAWNVPVEDTRVPSCDSFTATPATITTSGADVTLAWTTTNAERVVIDNAIGEVDADGSLTVNPLDDTTYRLTVFGLNDQQVSCEAPVDFDPEEEVFTCADNVVFTASDTSIRRGNDVTLTWSTTDVDTVSISGINATSLSGSQVVSPTSDVTYILTATNGNKSVECPLSIDVDGGGGGGGSSSPRCELEISDKVIRLGEEIELTWDTTRATEVTLTDDRGNVLFTTDDYTASEKEDYYDGSITLRPTRNTEYILLAERGSRDRECRVEVEIENDVVVLQTRDQQPLVAGISLSEVPYTGFEAGPLMTTIFYIALAAWAFYISYLLVIRNRTVEATGSVAGPSNNQISMKIAEEVRPDVFASVTAPEKSATAIAPNNLPTGMPVVGYENAASMTDEVTDPHQATDEVVTDLENRAHAKKALLSSDAVRHFIATTTNASERNQALDEVIEEAKKVYPLEDGWIVINEARMKNMCLVCKVNELNQPKSFRPATIPEGSGSLAEAIASGNITAAYEMIGNRPMFALADAAADLDSIYRNRRGASEVVSEMLQQETANLSDDQIKNMIKALTSALDGTYTDEASAVKMAIMKAVKEVA